jgi:pimeloyl-ACP methyl ester carboxylesterase
MKKPGQWSRLLMQRVSKLGLGYVISAVLLSIPCATGFTSSGSGPNRYCGYRSYHFIRNNDSVKALFVTFSSSSSQEEEEADRPRAVNFSSPLLEYGYPPAVEAYNDKSLSEKPLLLYLPGFDGTYICPFIQFPELGTDFDVRCMTVGMKDRSTYDELKQGVLDYILTELQLQQPQYVQTTSTTTATTTFATASSKYPPLAIVKPISVDVSSDGDKADKNATNPGSFFSSLRLFKPRPATEAKVSTHTMDRPIYIAGESFGGLLASDVALDLIQDDKKRFSNLNLQGLILINPATCFDRSQLASKGPAVSTLPKLLYPFGLLGLFPLFTDEHSVEQLLLILQAKGLPSVIDTPSREAYMGRVAFSLPWKLEYMPQGTLQWRLTKWLEVGCAKMESKLQDFCELPSFRTLVIAGEKDMTLPSIAEAERLANLLPNCQVHVVEGAGHASTSGSRMDMAAVLRSRFTELQKQERSKDKSKEQKEEKKRTAMKPVAAKGKGAYLGMEPRYDGATIGLNPILYWSKDFYRPVKE